MATYLREAEEMIAVCDENNVKLTINHTRRWGWQYRNAKELVGNGEIGQSGIVQKAILFGKFRGATRRIWQSCWHRLRFPFCQMIID